MSTTAFLFPGQGSQFVGMGRDLFDEFPTARRCFERADARLSFSLSEKMFGTEDAAQDASGSLRQTDVTQPALYVHSLAVAEVLRERGLLPDMVAGHSLGEYSALAASGAIKFEEGLDLVRLRGRLMAKAGERRRGTMAAVLGMDDEDVHRVCSEATEEPDSIVEIANYNSPGQVVISGDPDAVDRAMNLAKAGGAKRVVPLPVSGAFHSPLMEDAREGLAEALLRTDIQKPECPVYLNVTATATIDLEEIRQRLLEQLTAPVRWAETMRRMNSDGAERFIEVGAGKVLSGLVKRTLGRDVATSAAGTADEIRALVMQSDPDAAPFS